MKVRKTLLLRFFIAAFATIYLGGCATGSALVTGVKRESINPDLVKVYHFPPANYELVGIVKSSSEMGFGEQHNLDLALEEIKEQAAKVGANGVILQGIEEVVIGGGGTFIPNGYGGGFFVSSHSTKQAVSGTAIYIKNN